MKATVRVISEVAGEPRPARQRVEAAAVLLGSRGFRVLHNGRFGVTVEAPTTTFRQQLGFRGVEGLSGSDAIQPPDAELARFVDRIEVLPEPSLFSR